MNLTRYPFKSFVHGWEEQAHEGSDSKPDPFTLWRHDTDKLYGQSDNFFLSLSPAQSIMLVHYVISSVQVVEVPDYLALSGEKNS